jgi:hypothetical protein
MLDSSATLSILEHVEFAAPLLYDDISAATTLFIGAVAYFRSRNWVFK